MKLLQGGRYGYLSFWEQEEFQFLKFKLHVPAKQKNQLQRNLLNLLAFSNNFWEEGAYFSHNL
jgi:hypothetical protein